MASQNDYNRINEYIIQPCQRLFGSEINDYAIEVIIEDLSQFDNETLIAAMVIIRQTCKRMPTLAHFMESCEEASKKTRKKISPKNSKYQQFPKDYPQEAHEVMSTEFGQLALREGWGSDLFIKTQRTGKKDWCLSDAAEFRHHLKIGVESAKSVDIAKEVMTEEQRKLFGITIDRSIAKALWKLWDAMRSREAELAAKYLVIK